MDEQQEQDQAVAAGDEQPGPGVPQDITGTGSISIPGLAAGGPRD